MVRCTDVLISFLVVFPVLIPTDVCFPTLRPLLVISVVFHVRSDLMLLKVCIVLFTPVSCVCNDGSEPTECKELRELLKQSDLELDGIPLTEEERRKIDAVLTGLFWAVKKSVM